MDPLQEGDPRRIGPYDLTGRLGEGGQGVVYRGLGPDGQEVAVKVLRAQVAADPKARERFVRELALAEKVAGFCTARVLDADVRHDRPYIVSEYVPGPSLQEFLHAEGPRNGPDLVRLAIGMVTALAAIHEAGIVHRDFKPTNVLMGPDGPRVIDFGIAKALDATSSMTSQVLGTPAYMAPEQIAGEPVGPPTDMFAWGATLLCAATGEPPFRGDSIPEVLHKILYAPADVSMLPQRLSGLVASCLDKDPAQRPTASQALLALLGRPADTTTDAATLLLNGTAVARADKPLPTPAAAQTAKPTPTEKPAPNENPIPQAKPTQTESPTHEQWPTPKQEPRPKQEKSPEQKPSAEHKPSPAYESSPEPGPGSERGQRPTHRRAPEHKRTARQTPRSEQEPSSAYESSPTYKPSSEQGPESERRRRSKYGRRSERRRRSERAPTPEHEPSSAYESNPIYKPSPEQGLESGRERKSERRRTAEQGPGSERGFTAGADSFERAGAGAGSSWRSRGWLLPGALGLSLLLLVGDLLAVVQLNTDIRRLTADETTTRGLVLIVIWAGTLLVIAGTAIAIGFAWRGGRAAIWVLVGLGVVKGGLELMTYVALWGWPFPWVHGHPMSVDYVKDELAPMPLLPATTPKVILATILVYAVPVVLLIVHLRRSRHLSKSL